jgi:hypothetical protein
VSDTTVPSELLQIVDPPPGLLEELGTKPLCGGRFTASWATGPLRGKRTSAYCAEPFCIDTGYCTGAKFVAHTIQHEADGTPRPLDPREIVPMARYAAIQATGKDDPRSDKHIFGFAFHVYQRMAQSLRGRM